jgi:hypothetical protein
MSWLSTAYLGGERGKHPYNQLLILCNNGNKNYENWHYNAKMFPLSNGIKIFELESQILCKNNILCIYNVLPFFPMLAFVFFRLKRNIYLF